MQRGFNKFGSIDIEGTELRYRIATEDIGTEDALELEKDIKRKLQHIEHEDRFVLPFAIQTINRYMVMYYKLEHYSDFNSLRELPLEDKISYYLSLVELGKIHEKGLHISWDRMNFVVDQYDKTIKALLFATDHLKIYETPEDITKTVKDFIITSMTILNNVISLPKRNDFIFTDDANIQFVEKLYRLESLDDIAMFLETVSLDIESKDSIEEVKTTKSKGSINKSPKSKPKKMVKQKLQRPMSNGKKKKKSYMKMYIVLGSVAALLLLLGPLLAPPTEGTEVTKVKGDSTVVVVNAKDVETIFKGSTEFENELVEAYRKAYNSDYTEAFNLLTNIPKESLDDKDVPLLMEVYYQTGNLHVLLDEVPALSNDLITYLFTRDKLEELPAIAEKMTAKNPYIEFEKAHLTEEYDYMLTLVDSIEINGRKEQQIIDAYLALDQVDEAHKFAEKVGNPDLIKRVEQFRD